MPGKVSSNEISQYCHTELLEGQTGLLQAAIPSEVSNIKVHFQVVDHDLAQNPSISESLWLLKFKLVRLFSFSCESEQRCQILLRNGNDISKRYSLSLGHLIKNIVMLICIQIDSNGYMLGESMWLTVSAWRRLHWRNLTWSVHSPLFLFILNNPSVPPCRAYYKFWLWFIDSLRSSRQLQTQFTCPFTEGLWLLYVSEDLQASSGYH